MSYDKKPEMILFDVGGTLLDDTPCVPIDGLSELRLAAKNPSVTTDEILAKLWDEYMEETSVGLKSKSGITLDFPLSSPIKYVAMKTGLRFDIPMACQEEIFDRFNSQRRVIDGVKELLDALGSLDIRTAVISNNAMSGESLHIALDRWVENNKFEFCLTSADLLFAKPHKSLFECATAYAGVEKTRCWYCGDGVVPDVDGGRNGGMTPVLIDVKSEKPIEWRTDGGREKYLTVNNWIYLRDYLMKL